MKLSFVIVNYNVKEYLEQLLLSLERSLENISNEIIVVDNASVDDSVAHIRNRFPDVKMIASETNLGFGRANNLALEQVRGEYVVMINPDTVVQEDTFSKLLAFFESEPKADAATCKIINPDGSFAVDCRHSIPTPMIAFWKVTGLSKLFPKSKLFARYNLTYLDPDETYPVPAISGSFMMVKKAVLDEIGYFDERFFMYCEDIDLCHRINEAGHTIYYVPTTQIIHYKGESTKKNNVDYVVTFNKALYQFFDKYYAQGSIFLFRWLIVIGIVLRGVFIYTRNFLREHFPLILDLFILNIVLLVSFIIRLQFKDGFLWADFFSQYWVINALSSFIFVLGGTYLEVYPRQRLSIQGIIKNTLLTFTILGCLTFFLKQFAFSRSVVLLAAIATPLLMIGWRQVLRNFFKGDRSAWGKDIFIRPTLLVGSGAGLVMLWQKIRDLRDISYNMIGAVTPSDENRELLDADIPVLGRLENLDQLIRIHRAQQVIFASDVLSYEQILQTMSQIDLPQLEYKIVPANLEFLIGKSTIERLDDYPLLEVDYAIGKPFNRLSKRVMDMGVGLISLILLGIFCLPGLLLFVKRLHRLDIYSRTEPELNILQVEGLSRSALLNRWLQLWEVVRGRLSLVGSVIQESNNAVEHTDYWYQPGITGLVQLNKNRIQSPEDAEQFDLFYIRNQSVFLDIQIIFRAILGLFQSQ
ncbi:MAG: glycosyltransferase [Calditrichia bacterium]